MKVLQLIDTLEAGGAERMTVHIANAINEQGISSYLCATRRGGALQKELREQVVLQILNKKSKVDIVAFRNFFKWLRKEEIEIIHAHSTSIFLAVLAKINNPRLKIVWHYHYGLSENLKDRSVRGLKLLARYVDVCISVNKPLKEWLEQVLKIDNVHFIENFSELSEGKKGQTILKGVEGKRVICLANLRHPKNHLALIKSFAKSIVKNSEWSLHLVGKSFEDDYSRSIQNLISELGLSEKIHLYGSCNDIAHILSQATIGVLSSHFEGLPVSLLEYGNSGLPVIVTDVGQCSDVVGNNGFIINNVLEEMPRVLIEMYTMDEVERKLKGKRFRESVLKKYSKQSFLNKLIPLYKDLLS